MCGDVSLRLCFLPAGSYLYVYLESLTGALLGNLDCKMKPTGTLGCGRAGRPVFSVSII